MTAFNPTLFRQQFPALNDAGVYLDSAGTVHRSQYAAARQLTERYERARHQVARLLNAPHGQQIVWTRGTRRRSTLSLTAGCCRA
nr:Cysteine sulfinate desulfinase [Candidatus Pantoea persica]